MLQIRKIIRSTDGPLSTKRKNHGHFCSCGTEFYFGFVTAHQDCFLILDQAVEIKIVTISTYEGFRKLSSNIQKYCTSINAYPCICSCLLHYLTVSGLVQRGITTLNLEDLHVFAGDTNLG